MMDEILLEERMVAYLDPGAEALLRMLNAPSRLSTTSSCLGRIALIEGEWPWERRRETRIVYKTHYYVTPQRLAMEMAKGFENLWLKVTGPIVHFEVLGFACAESLLAIARQEGFKHSGIISIDDVDERLIVEVMAPTQFSTPLRLGSVQMVSGLQLVVLARKANRALAEGRKRLARLAMRILGLAECGANHGPHSPNA